jgi:4-amino-4-deoxy-L-arabinose transferase-like glycosyltransferase
MTLIRQYWLLLLLALPFFVALDDSSLWDSNEAFYAQTPREMVEQGNWSVPSFNGKPRLNKPPLSYWVVAPFYTLFSPSVFWERFPMALLAYGSVLAVFLIGKFLYDRQVALLAAGIFATTFRFLILSRRLLIDVLVLFCVLWVVAFFLSWIHSQKRYPFLLASLFLGLAFLAKGPVAFLPLFFLGLYLWISGQMHRLVQAPWLAGGLIYFFLCSFWFALLGITTGWEPVLEFFLSDNLGRFVSVDFGPQRGYFYYVGVFLGDFFPWSFFFPAAVIWTLQRKNGSTPEEKNRHWILLSLWIGTYFLLFSLSHNKQEYYILPLYPAAALWVALYFRRARPSMILSAIVAALLTLLALSLFAIVRVLFDEPWLWLPLLFVPALVWGLVRRRYALALASLTLFYFASFALYLEPFEAFKPVHHFAERIRANEAQQNFQAGYYKLAAPSLAFYLDQPIFELGDLQAAVSLLESETTVYMIVSAEDYSELAQATPQPLQIVEERPKLYTTARTLIEGFRRDRSDNLRESWTRPIYLITNRGDL